jgi:hypothetical protein
MNQKKPAPHMILIAIGLLLVVSPLLLKEFIRIPDFVRGAMMGMGIVFEIAGIAAQIKQKNNRCKTTPADPEI